ncbi:hypothetical protein HS68_16185 [Listeria monocytogenes]|uniref:gp37 n=1 Tax=Listeria phage B054 TaxID=330397 RepID=UPI00015C01A6|nr:gp37 [Listeria phage B054]EFK40546.1 phage protein [Listeria monocytogenes FSL N1-017]KET58586.1 hypothetical protein HS09_14795 [Listeria monocytogenes]AAY53142.1 gp37 [Listeria phage B054]KEU20633.1 hypothetical protein HS23_14075 [Listeria monocytogenes]KEU84859.1 hypothetical protein HS47_14070 [Listeria monocytogenes]
MFLNQYHSFLLSYKTLLTFSIRKFPRNFLYRTFLSLNIANVFKIIKAIFSHDIISQLIISSKLISNIRLSKRSSDTMCFLYLIISFNF